MLKKYCIVLGGILLLVGAGCLFKKEGVAPVTQGIPQKQIDIAVSIYPIAHFVQKVGGDLVNVHLITPGGIEPHEYQPTPTDIVTVQSSKALVYNGAGLDTWADRVAPELAQKGIQVLKMSDHIAQELKAMPAPKIGESDEAGSDDPHVWLDPMLAQKEVEYIVELLTTLDPTHADIFKNNAKLYLGELTKLDQEYKEGLANCRLKEIITSHDAFNYLGRRYGITVHAIAGISPEDEPSSARLAQLARLIKQKKIKTVFFESLITPKLSETLATETGAESAVLDPIEGITAEDAQAGINYDILMRENLEALKKAMVCH